MPLSGLYIRFTDVNRRKDYPVFVQYNGYHYETKSNALTASVVNNLSEQKLSTRVSLTTSYDTLNALIVSIANEDSRIFEQPVAVYAYYDV